MHQQPSIHHINIPKIPKCETRPLWSVVIPTYNCAKYLKETLLSILVQDPGEDQMEIIVVDDHSTLDNPEAVVKSVGKGRVKFFKQPKNVGKSRNYTYGINVSKGKYIHLLHGDDTVDVGFYKKIQNLFLECHEVSAAFCQCRYINAESCVLGNTELLSEDKGVLKNFIDKIAIWQCIQPPSIVFKRKVYEELGTYDKRLKNIEDWEFYVRSALHHRFAYLPEKLANYRIYAENSSNQSIKEGKLLTDIKQVIKIIDAYLPDEIKKKIRTQRKQATASYVLNFIPQILVQKDFKGFWKYSKAFFEYNRSVRLVGRWFRFILQYKKFYKPI